jgi:hypothetical protein
VQFECEGLDSSNGFGETAHGGYRCIGSSNKLGSISTTTSQSHDRSGDRFLDATSSCGDRGGGISGRPMEKTQNPTPPLTPSR